MHLCTVRHRINITCDDPVLTHIFYAVQWASRCAMLLGEILVLYWTLKRTQLKYTTFNFANISVPVAFGRTRTLADIMQENGQSGLQLPVITG